MSRNLLTFAELREANMMRITHFKDTHGRKAHTEPDGSDWSLGDWMVAVSGEVGEAANIIKKIRRGDFTVDEARLDLADELADVQIYLDILAARAGIDLAEATARKWNAVSKRIGWPGRLPADD